MPFDTTRQEWTPTHLPLREHKLALALLERAAAHIAPGNPLREEIANLLGKAVKP